MLRENMASSNSQKKSTSERPEGPTSPSQALRVSGLGSGVRLEGLRFEVWGSGSHGGVETNAEMGFQV